MALGLGKVITQIDYRESARLIKVYYLIFLRKLRCISNRIIILKIARHTEHDIHVMGNVIEGENGFNVRSIDKIGLVFRKKKNRLRFSI